MIAQLNSTDRFDSALNVNVSEFATSLVPYPRINIVTTTLSPLYTFNEYRRYCHDPLFNVTNLQEEIFLSEYSFVKSNLLGGRHTSCCMYFKGNVVPKDINKLVSKIKAFKIIDFVDWCPTGFKCGIGYQPP